MKIGRLADGDPARRSTCAATADRTRDAVARTVLERGPQSAADLAERARPVARGRSAATSTRWSPTACSSSASPRPSARRGRGRPARTYALTDAGRAAFPHAYDDLASTALRYLRETGGEQAVAAFAEHRADTAGRRAGRATSTPTAPLDRARRGAGRRR